MGGAQEILDSGPTLATVLKSGAWLSACYKNYLGLKSDEETNISTLLLAKLGSDSNESDPDHHTKRAKRVKKRTQKAPLACRNNIDPGNSEKSDLSTSDSD